MHLLSCKWGVSGKYLESLLSRSRPNSTACDAGSRIHRLYFTEPKTSCLPQLLSQMEDFLKSEWTGRPRLRRHRQVLFDNLSSPRSQVKYTAVSKDRYQFQTQTTLKGIFFNGVLLGRRIFYFTFHTEKTSKRLWYFISSSLSRPFNRLRWQVLAIKI